MARKRTLELSDIQDETDIYDRLVLKQRKLKKKLTSVRGSPLLLSDKVRIVEENRKGTKSSTIDVDVKPHAETDDDISHGISNEELPVIVESHLLQQEMSIHSIPNIQILCRDIIERYDDFELGQIFPDTEQNHMFRLFVSAASFGLLDLLKFPRDTLGLYVSVLRGIASKQKVKKVMETRFARVQDSVIPELAELATKGEDSGQRIIIRVSEPFKITKRITQLLDEANI